MILFSNFYNSSAKNPINVLLKVLLAYCRNSYCSNFSSKLLSCASLLLTLKVSRCIFCHKKNNMDNKMIFDSLWEKSWPEKPLLAWLKYSSLCWKLVNFRLNRLGTFQITLQCSESIPKMFFIKMKMWSFILISKEEKIFCFTYYLSIKAKAL